MSMVPDVVVSLRFVQVGKKGCKASLGHHIPLDIDQKHQLRNYIMDRLYRLLAEH